MHVKLADAPATRSDKPAECHAKLFRGRRGLEDLAADWTRLTDRLSQPRFFHRVDWFRCYLDALEPEPDRVFFCAVYCGDQVEAIFPLKRVFRYAWGIKVTSLELPYHDHMPFVDFIIADSEKAERHVRTLLDKLEESAELRWDRISLLGVLGRPRGPFALASQTELVSTCDHVGHSNYFEIGPYDDLFRRFSQNSRSNMRRARKRLASLESAHFTSAAKLPELEQAYEEFLDLEASGWKGPSGTRTAIKLDRQLTVFYRQLVRRFAPWGGCEVHFLRLGNKPIAAQFLLVVGDVIYQLKIAYDENHPKLAPGNMLQEHVLKECEDRPSIKKFSLISGMPWHEKFSPLRHEVYALHVYKPTLRGRLAWAYDRLRRRARSFAYARLRPIYRKLRGKPTQH